MNTTPENFIRRPLATTLPAKLEIHFAAAFPVEFVVRQLEDVPLWLHGQMAKSSPVVVSSVPTLQPN